MNAIVWWFEHSLALPFFEIGTKIDLFQSCGHCWVFQICWHIECSTLAAASFRIWKSSAGIPSPPLALFTVMLPKAHLTLHSRMSGCRWVTIPSWLFGSLRPFLYSYSVYSCHIFLISSASLATAKSLQSCLTLCDWLHRRQPTRLRLPWDSPGNNTRVGCHFLLQCMKVKSESKVTQSCPTLSDPMDCSLPGSSIHGIFQARVLEWGSIAFSGTWCMTLLKNCCIRFASILWKIFVSMFISCISL